MNRIYLLFDQIPFKPTYFVSINELVLKQFSDEISQLTMPKFINWNTRADFDVNDKSIMFLKDTLKLTDEFSTDLTGRIFSGGTVTFVALQIAYYMGFDNVILIGVDHSFSTKGDPNAVVVSEGDDPDHFDPTYFGRGFRWQLPDLETSEMAYRLARLHFARAGRHILDATVGGKLDVFPKVRFEDLF